MPTIGWFEILIIVTVAIIVIGPKDFPFVLKKIGSWIGSVYENGFDGFKGYWFQVSEDVEFSFNLDNAVLARKNSSYQKEVLPGYEYTQSSQQAFVSQVLTKL